LNAITIIVYFTGIPELFSCFQFAACLPGKPIPA